MCIVHFTVHHADCVSLLASPLLTSPDLGSNERQKLAHRVYAAARSFWDLVRRIIKQIAKREASSRVCSSLSQPTASLALNTREIKQASAHHQITWLRLRTCDREACSFCSINLQGKAKRIFFNFQTKS